jgi:hypothetical protein
MTQKELTASMVYEVGELLGKPVSAGTVERILERAAEDPQELALSWLSARMDDGSLKRLIAPQSEVYYHRCEHCEQPNAVDLRAAMMVDEVTKQRVYRCVFCEQPNIIVVS